tara:strand:- start:43180 stop:43461 length:282 start_codon:yes stop_codon:yes gene_type:complete
MFNIVEVIRKRGDNIDKSYVVVDVETRKTVADFNHKYQAEMFITRKTDYKAISDEDWDLAEKWTAEDMQKNPDKYQSIQSDNQDIFIQEEETK